MQNIWLIMVKFNMNCIGGMTSISLYITTLNYFYFFNKEVVEKKSVGKNYFKICGVLLDYELATSR